MKAVHHFALSVSALLLCSLVSLGLAQTTHEVQLLFVEAEMGPPQFYFEPVGLHIQPGDTVRFIAASPHHTVTAYHGAHVKPQRVPEGVEPFSSPVIPAGGTWEYTFTTPGTYDVWCAPHESFGMVMRLVVGEPGGPAEEPVTDFGPVGAFGAAGTMLNDPALDSLNIMSQGSVTWEEISPEAKMPPQEGAAPEHNHDAIAQNQ